jgi:hypothetical protein
MEGDQLKLKIGYGGCIAVDFDLVCGGFKTNGGQTQAVVRLRARAFPGHCLAFHHADLCFDISALRSAEKHGELGISFENYKGKPVIYTY